MGSRRDAECSCCGCPSRVGRSTSRLPTRPRRCFSRDTCWRSTTGGDPGDYPLRQPETRGGAGHARAGTGWSPNRSSSSAPITGWTGSSAVPASTAIMRRAASRGYRPFRRRHLVPVSPSETIGPERVDHRWRHRRRRSGHHRSAGHRRGGVRRRAATLRACRLTGSTAPGCSSPGSTTVSATGEH